MQLTVLSDGYERWRWQFVDDSGVAIVVGELTFETFAAAQANAEAICREIFDAPIEVMPQLSLVPSANPGGDH